jgi:molybdopterin synthase catalytic subunit
MIESPYFVEGPLSRDVAAALEAAWSGDGAIGAQAWFHGQIRSDAIQAGTVTAIEYSAERVLAEASIAEIRERALTRYGCIDIWIRHSLGIVPSGGISFIVGVASAHRAAAFDALRMVVDAVKAETPVFGKELTDSGYHWKVNTD